MCILGVMPAALTSTQWAGARTTDDLSLHLRVSSLPSRYNTVYMCCVKVTLDAVWLMSVKKAFSHSLL